MEKTKDMNHRICALCSSVITKHAINDVNEVFCCIGCHTVFRILSSRHELDNIQKNPLFTQALRSGLISNPALLSQIQNNQIDIAEGEWKKLYFEVGDLWCPACAEVIKLILQNKRGVRRCVVDYATDLACVDYAPRYLSKEKIFAVLKSLGYTPLPLEDGQRQAVSFSLYFRFIVAAFFSLNIMMFSYPIYASYFNTDGSGASQLFIWLSFAASLPVLGYSGWPIAKKCWNSVRVGIVGMEFLILMGVGASFGLSVYEICRGGTHVYFDAMSVVITLVLLGKIIESKAKFSSRECVLRLSKATPKRGRKRFDPTSHTPAKELFVPVKEIKQGDIILVFTGEKIVLDGRVIEGKGACDESVMTGEVALVRKDVGSFVLGGTILCQGWLAFQVTATEEMTALHQIIQTIEKDLDHKTLYTRAIDPIVSWFVPCVIIVALGSMAGCCLYGSSFEEAIIRAVSVLLIACPCAIGIAAPLAESHVLAGLAQLGAIVRNRGCLSLLGRETVCVFDKTGTVTEGRFQLLKGLESLTVEEKKILKGLAAPSSHPIAIAIAQAIEESPQPFVSVEEVVGRGMQADNTYFLGSATFLRQMGVSLPGEEDNDATTITRVFFSHKNQLIATLYLGDQIRKGVAKMLKTLVPTETVLVSGDQKNVVKAVAKACGFRTYRWECHPLEKRDYIESLRKQGEVVCMIGDGVNDAPALTCAHVGISVVSATDVSIQVSDLLLTTDRCDVIPKIRNLAKRGRKIVHQNLFWAFFYNTIGIGLAVSGYLHPIFSAFAMVTSSCIVLFNGQRIR